MNERLPILRIQVDSMKHAIATVLDDRHHDLQQCIAAGIDAAIKELPNQIAQEARQMSRELMLDAMRQAITDYWQSGAGRKLVEQMVEQQAKGATP